VVGAGDRERGSALVFALAALTLVAITVVAVTAEVQSRAAGVVLEERSVRLVALSDAAMAETMAELAVKKTFAGISERGFAGGSIASTVRFAGAWEVEVTAIGRRNDWNSTLVARVNIKNAPRALRWRRTQRPDEN